jgi:hypothetical protein
VDYDRLVVMVQSELPISVPIYHRLGPHLFATTRDRSDRDTTSTLEGASFSKGAIKLIAAIGAVGRSIFSEDVRSRQGHVKLQKTITPLFNRQPYTCHPTIEASMPGSPTNLRWLTLGAFAIGTAGFVIAGLLPALARDLNVSLPAVGNLVSAFSLAYAIDAPRWSSPMAQWGNSARWQRDSAWPRCWRLSAAAGLATGHRFQYLQRDVPLV